MNDKEVGDILQSDVLVTMDGVVLDDGTLHVVGAYQLWFVPEVSTVEAYERLARHFAQLAAEVRADQN